METVHACTFGRLGSDAERSPRRRGPLLRFPRPSQQTRDNPPRKVVRQPLTTKAGVKNETTDCGHIGTRCRESTGPRNRARWSAASVGRRTGCVGPVSPRDRSGHSLRLGAPPPTHVQGGEQDARGRRPGRDPERDRSPGAARAVGRGHGDGHRRRGGHGRRRRGWDGDRRDPVDVNRRDDLFAATDCAYPDDARARCRKRPDHELGREAAVRADRDHAAAAYVAVDAPFNREVAAELDDDVRSRVPPAPAHAHCLANGGRVGREHQLRAFRRPRRKREQRDEQRGSGDRRCRAPWSRRRSHRARTTTPMTTGMSHHGITQKVDELVNS